MRNLVFLFVFVFSILRPLAIVSGNTKTDTSKKESTSHKFLRPVSNWQTAEATYYDSQDQAQTRAGGDGIGSFGRLIKSGSIAIGSAFITELSKENEIVFVQIENFNVMTPYGKGIYRVDDTMAERFRKKGKLYVDFFHKDLNLRLKQKGRFNVKLRFLKMITKTDSE